MIPYVEWRTIAFGPLTLQVWGLFAALGFVTGIACAVWRMRYVTHTDAGWVWDMGIWLLAGSIIGARLGHVWWYEPAYFAAHPWDIIRIWDGGLSSYGGFVGGVFAAWLFYKRHAFDFWRAADAFLWAFPFGWILGRVGCALIHDHPGRLTDSFFGVQYTGGARFDLGLLEMAALIPLALVFFFLRRAKYARQVFIISFAMYYGVIRFLLDFLRATDVTEPDARYFGLTPAQYGSVILVMVGIWIWFKNQKHGRFA